MPLGDESVLGAAPGNSSRVLEIDPLAGATRLFGDEILGVQPNVLAAAPFGLMRAAPRQLRRRTRPPRMARATPATPVSRWALIGEGAAPRLPPAGAGATGATDLRRVPESASRAAATDDDAESSEEEGELEEVFEDTPHLLKL